MSRVDENGIVHPTDEDPWDAQAQTHYAFCKTCNIYAMPEEMLREAKADAWDEGMQWADTLQSGKDLSDNPYRVRTQPGKIGAGDKEQDDGSEAVRPR